MDRNQTIGIILITVLIFAWSIFTSPSREEVEMAQRKQDSIERVRQQQEADSIAAIDPAAQPQETIEPAQDIDLGDSAQLDQALAILGPFAAQLQGSPETFTIENEDIIVTINSKGAVITDVTLKQYEKVSKTREGVNQDGPVRLLEDAKNKMTWHLPFGNPTGSETLSDRLYFKKTKQSEKSITLEATGQGNKQVQFTYSLGDNGYQLKQELSLAGIDADKTDKPIRFDWVNFLDKIEQNESYEKIYSTVYFKEAEEDPDYCSCRSDDQESIAQPIQWVSHANQFFNSTMIPERPFLNGSFETVTLEEDADDLKLLKSSVELASPENAGAQYVFNWYIGPNDFEQLAAFDQELEMIIPFGWSIFGTINRWVVRPLFNFLFHFMGSQGIAIIILTLIVKFALYPLTYKMLHSQAKMSVLKPEMEKIRNKFKDKPQEQQVEMMKLYREFGVNPLGGCLPMALQMPIWFALYRFFPASLEFRQASFWWAHDLSSFDAIAFLPFEIPFFGSHISLFTLLWSATMLIYAAYNMKLMDPTTASNPMLKYMQFITPIMFIFFFNNYASGLTCYLFFSTLINIIQTVGTKEIIFDDEKILAELEANKSKPKKKSAFQQRLEDAMKEQQKQKQSRSDKRK